MHKLMPVTEPPFTVERVKLHYVPAGAAGCQYCCLSAPRMRMFYTDNPAVWMALEMRDVLPYHVPKFVDDQGRVIHTETCVKLPF
jgi:hypothetical protein